MVANYSEEQDLIRQLEVPKVNAWQVAELARHAARDVKVVLSGLGGDELFYGYNMHSIMARTQSIGRLPGAARRAAGGLLAALLRLAPTPWSEPQRMALMLAEAGNWPRVYGLLRNVWDAPDLRRKLYGPRLLDQPLPDAFDELAARWPQAPDPVTAAARFEWREKMVQQLLPGEILTRPKSGFQVDAGQFWQQLQPLAETWLSDEAVRKDMYDRIQEIVVRDMPYINVFEEQKTSLVRPGWTGFAVMPDGFNKSISWFGVYAVSSPDDAE